MPKAKIFTPTPELLNSTRLYRTLLSICGVSDQEITKNVMLFMHHPERISEGQTLSDDQIIESLHLNVRIEVMNLMCRR